jgi:hypothetical protein
MTFGNSKLKAQSSKEAPMGKLQREASRLKRTAVLLNRSVWSSIERGKTQTQILAVRAGSSTLSWARESRASASPRIRRWIMPYDSSKPRAAAQESRGPYAGATSPRLTVSTSPCLIVLPSVPLGAGSVVKKSVLVLLLLLSFALGSRSIAAPAALAPMLNIPGAGEEAAKIDYAALPVLKGEHAVISQGAAPWVFRLHSYLEYFEGKYWCMWSHGPVVEDKPTQHIRYATSADGLHWSADKLIVGPSALEGRRYIARGLWVREGKLIALATLDDANAAKTGKTPWSADLTLLEFEWNAATQAWGPGKVIFADTMSNFAPRKLPDGNWAMLRRDHKKNVTLLAGGVESASQWQVWPVVTAKDPALKAEEPEWWTLPDQRLLGLFRDNSRSGRFFRAVSADNGRTWTPPEKTNFPDATSKFFCHRTSAGYYVLVSNTNPAMRNPLCLSTSDDGVTFTRMFRLPIPAGAATETTSKGGKQKAAEYDSLQYPHILEREGDLFISYSRRKTGIEIVKVALSEVGKLRGAK